MDNDDRIPFVKTLDRYIPLVNTKDNPVLKPHQVVKVSDGVDADEFWEFIKLFIDAELVPFDDGGE